MKRHRLSLFDRLCFGCLAVRLVHMSDMECNGKSQVQRCSRQSTAALLCGACPLPPAGPGLPASSNNRIHLPSAAGYQREEAARRPYPLLLLNDGQNLFFDKE